MTSSHLRVLVIAGLSACASSSAESQSPETPEGGGTTAKPEADPAPDRARDSTTTKHERGPTRAAVKVASKKPARKSTKKADGGEETPKAKRKPTSKFAVSGFAPTFAAPGSILAIHGAGFGDLSNTSVKVGEADWDVLEVYPDHLLVTVPSGAASGAVSVTAGKKTVTAEAGFTALTDVEGFGKPAASPHGLIGELFNAGATDKLPEFSGSPLGTIVLSVLDVALGQFAGFPGLPGDGLAIRFQGSLNVADAGEYRLCLESDDGSQLYLEDTLVIDNDGIHETVQACELAYLEPGEYGLRIHYFQSTGAATLKLLWAKDGGELAVVPETSLFRPGL